MQPFKSKKEVPGVTEIVIDSSFDEISEKLASLNFPIESTLPENTAAALRKKLEQLKV